MVEIKARAKCNICRGEIFEVAVRNDDDLVDGHEYGSEYWYCINCGMQHLRCAVYEHHIKDGYFEVVE